MTQLAANILPALFVTGRHIPGLARGETGVVGDHNDNRDVMPNGRVHLHAVPAEGTVAGQNQDGFVRRCHLGPDAERHAYAHTAVWAGIEAAADVVHGNGLARKIEDFMSVHDQNGVAADRLADFLTQAEWMDRGGVRVQQRSRALHIGALFGRKLGNPGGFLIGVKLATGFFRQLPQNKLGVADNADGHPSIMTNGSAVQIDVDKLCRGRKTGSAEKRQHGVRPRTNDQHNVSLTKGHGPGRGKGAIMILGNNAATLRSGEKGNAGGLDKPLQFRAGLRPQDTATGHNEGFLGLGQKLDRLFDQSWVSSRPTCGPIILRPVDFLFVNLMRQHIARQIEIHRAFLAVHGFAKGNTSIFGHPLGHINAIRRLDHGLHHGDLVHLLKGIERGRPHGS